MKDVFILLLPRSATTSSLITLFWLFHSPYCVNISFRPFYRLKTFPSFCSALLIFLTDTCSCSLFKRRDLCLYVTFLVIFQTVSGSTFTSICEQKHELSRKVEKLNITEHMIHFYLRNKYKSVYARVYTVKTQCLKI